MKATLGNPSRKETKHKITQKLNDLSTEDIYLNNN